jgi:cysteine-rich repeat protein
MSLLARHRAGPVQVLTLAALGAVVGCDGCGGPGADAGPTAVLTMQAVGGTTLEADGVSTKTVNVTAFDGSSPDTSEVSITAPSGTLSSDEGSLDGDTLKVSSDTGAFSFQYMCDADATGQVTISATNANTTQQIAINCVAPQGQPLLTLDIPQLCSSLPADGDTTCEITATFESITNAGQRAPRVGEGLVASVVAATLEADENTPPGTPASDLFYLAPDAGIAPSQQLALLTDDNGQASFHVRGKLDELVAIEINVSAPSVTGPDGTPVNTGTIVRTSVFESSAGVTVTATPQQIAGAANSTSTIHVDVINPFGQPAADEMVQVTVPENAGASIEFGGVIAPTDGAVLDVTLDAAGGADITFTPPVLSGEVIEIPVNVTYTPIDTLPAVNGSVVVTVLPPDALIVNVIAEPDTINSTDNEASVITVRAQRFNNGALTDVSGATVDFEVQSSDTERVGFGNRVGASTDLSVTSSATTDASGAATVTVSTQNDRVRGPAGIDVMVTAGSDTVERSVEIVVEREPILQSIVFMSANPDQIAVRGSAYPTSSEVSFRVLDDLNNPMPNVAVSFNTNGTADPAASVVPFGFTDGGGNVSTVLAAGTEAGPISIVARAQFAGIQLVAESTPIAVTGGLPSFANSYVVCDGSVYLPPFSANCTAVLADRFTNFTPSGLQVQFRSEGGNITPNNATGAQGGVGASFASGPPGSASTSLLDNTGGSWSHGLALPFSPLDLVDSASFSSADCFDADSTAASRCNIVGMCNEAGNSIFCPLPPDFAGNDCWDNLEAGALRPDEGFSAALLADPAVSGMNAAAIYDMLHYESGEPAIERPAVVYNDPTNPNHAAMRAVVDRYLANQRSCGFETACLTGVPGGLEWLTGDECGVAMGCLDFNPQTRCPSDGLLTVTAIARGEESFTDLNGNGILDYDDVNGNGRHDRGEPITEMPGQVLEFHDVVVDMPEPTLDKNDNCYYDDYEDVPRLLTWDKVRLGDQFNDEDGDGLYGYTDAVTGERRLTNELWDRDKQIFFQTHMLQLEGGPYFEYGQPCSAPGPVTCDWPSDGSRTGTCEEYGPGVYLAQDCIPGQGDTIDFGETFDLSYRFVDGNGNCFSPGLAADTHVFDNFQLQVSGQTEADIGLTECGLGAGRNNNQPWCEDVPGIGGALTNLTVTADCLFDIIYFNEFRTSYMSIHLHGTGTAEDLISRDFFWTVDCPFCGDGFLEGVEECDDGNFDSTDGCGGCEIQAGFTCDTLQEPTVCTPIP